MYIKIVHSESLLQCGKVVSRSQSTWCCIVSLASLDRFFSF